MINEEVYEYSEGLIDEAYFEEDFAGYGDEQTEGLGGSYLEEDYFEEDLVGESGLDEYGLEEEYLEEDILDELYGPSGSGVRPHGRPEEFLEEKLEVDLGEASVKRGWTGIPESEYHLAEEEILALEQDSLRREKNEKLRNAAAKLSVVNETITKHNKKLTNTLDKSARYMTRLREAILVLEKKLGKVNLDNAKLLYQNKALTSDSLNERQKHKLAEAITNAESIEEAKVIFETLQNTVGSTSRKKQPNSLSEAVQKSSSMILSARDENSKRQKIDPTLDRWKFLAGIDKN